MGVDWHGLDWTEYQKALTGWNASHEPTEQPKSLDPDRLKRFAAAHSLH